MDPDEPMHYNNMGILFLEIEEPEAAIPFFNRAIERDPDAALYHSNLGYAYKEMDDWETANREFQEAIELGDREFEKSMAEIRP